MSTSQLTKQLLDFSASSPTAISNDEKRALMAACEKVQLALESPLETTIRFMFGTFQIIALSLGVHMELLDQGVKAQDPITADQLACGSTADVELVGAFVRVMRILITMGIFEEVGHHTYIASQLAKFWTTDSPLREVVIHVSSQLPPIAHLPTYLEQTAYRNPHSASNGPFQHAYHTTQHYFTWLHHHPKIQSAFNATMTIARAGRGQEWFDFYPVEEKLLCSTDGDPAEILLVDIGGNLGQDLIRFQSRFSNVRGRLVFTDLPDVVASVEEERLPQSIEPFAHDFFTPHPVCLRGANAYYLRMILHDWPDAQARQILANIRPLMGKESVLLINQNALLDDNVPFYAAVMDWIMMGAFSSRDRTAGQFEELLEGAGFRVVGVWRPGDYGDGSGMLFEAVVKE